MVRAVARTHPHPELGTTCALTGQDSTHSTQSAHAPLPLLPSQCPEHGAKIERHEQCMQNPARHAADSGVNPKTKATHCAGQRDDDKLELYMVG